LSGDDQSAEGVWDINGFQGTFQMDRGGQHPLDHSAEPVDEDEAIPAR
jgi:hypothetical protein